MTKEIEIKEAVEEIETAINEDDLNKLRRNDSKVLWIILNLAQQYLKAEMPREITIEEVKPKLCPYSETIKCCTAQDYARNQALHDSRLWNMKRLEKVEEVIPMSRKRTPSKIRENWRKNE